MKLAQIRKYRSAIRNNVLFFLFIFFLFQSNVKAQNYKLTFSNIPLSEALIRISGQLNIKVAFDAKKLGSQIISKEVKGNTVEELISNLLSDTEFGYKYKYSRYLIVDKEKEKPSKTDPEYQLVGSVTDRESGEQLPFATVILYDKNLQICASDKGSFSIKNIKSNPVHLFISYIGYNKLDTSIYLSDQISNFDLRLIRQIHSLDSIEVKGERLEMVDLRNDVDFATTVNMSRLLDLPAVSETDIFRILQIIPGISYIENSQGLNIRGGSSDQNLILYDGQTLYNLSHYYGIVSVLNPNVIKDMQVYKGGFDSRFGERVSGIVDISGKTGNQTKPSFYGDLNLLSANLTTEIPFGKKISFIGAVRRSYSDIYSTGLSDKLTESNAHIFRGDSSNIINETRPKFYFYDYNAKFTLKPSNIETFSLSFFGGRDYFRNNYSGSSNKLQINSCDKSLWSNYGLSANWSRQWNESLFTNIQAGSSGYEAESSNSTEVNLTSGSDIDPQFLPDSINVFNTLNKNRINDIYLNVRNSYKTNQNNQVDFGLLIRRNEIFYHKDAEHQFVYDNTDQIGWTISAYVQDRISVNKLTIKPGLRYSFYKNSGSLYMEPRFSINYIISEKFSIRAAAGRYYQFINQVLSQQETGYNKNFWIMADSREHPVVASNHFIAGFTSERDRFLLDAEVYYKTYSGIQENIFVSQFLRNSDFPEYFPGNDIGKPPVHAQMPPSIFVTGTGRSFGSDLLLRYKTRNYTSWLSYSFGRSIQNYSVINSGSDIPAPCDQPYQVSWTNMLSAGRWNFAAISYYSSGRPYIDYSASGIMMPVTRNYKRLPDSFRSDVSVNYNFKLHNSKFKTGFTLINIFNTKNYLDVNTRTFDFENTSFLETTLIQAQSFSLNMFIHFVF
jgi:ferric enterobactin receptor